MQKILKQVMIGAGLVAGLATSAQAQYLTDAGSPLGGGGGASGSVANYLGNFGAAAAAIEAWQVATTVSIPNGDAAIPVNAAARTAFYNAVLGADRAPLVAALGGGAAAQAFADALAGIQGTPNNITPQSARTMIDTFNALVDSPSASTDALATVRAGLVAVLLLKQ